MPSPFPGMNPYLEQEDAWLISAENVPGVAEELTPESNNARLVRGSNRDLANATAGNVASRLRDFGSHIRRNAPRQPLEVLGPKGRRCDTVADGPFRHFLQVHTSFVWILLEAHKHTGTEVLPCQPSSGGFQ